MIAVETLYLTALLSAFIGLIALFVMSASRAGRPVRSSFLGNLIILATVVSLGSFFVYALSPRGEARSVYGASSLMRLGL